MHSCCRSILFLCLLRCSANSELHNTTLHFGQAIDVWYCFCLFDSFVMLAVTGGVAKKESFVILSNIIYNVQCSRWMCWFKCVVLRHISPHVLHVNGIIGDVFMCDWIFCNSFHKSTSTNVYLVVCKRCCIDGWFHIMFMFDTHMHLNHLIVNHFFAFCALN